MDINLALMTGIDIPIPEIKGILHQPTIKEISFLGEQQFFLGLQTTVLNKNMFKGQGNSLLENTTNFQIFMTIMKEQETRDKKEAVSDFLQLIFPKRKATFSPNSILLLSEGEEAIIIDENNFEAFQEYLKNIFCLNSSMNDQQNFNPADEKAREIAEKLMKGRQRVAAQKGEANGSIFTRYVSILTIGLNSMSLSNALNLTMYQLYDLMERYTLYLNWDLDVRTRLAGGKPDSKPDDWMKNIH